ncbi:centrosomal protein of 295 kDa isoform X2 [Anabas testudineus]|uniref:centrosomal protein of 295 kDa isoform X2 n=1 Tax=Anabas testudineus TaxID=64144 RepID=UPI000E45DD8D|nr:centrosomal protein of 295 kDa isoform X2 [Anabas testudineus]
MKRKVSKLRLSPNEEARLIREERERRRKLRIQQVREQQRYIALQIRQEVERRRQHELEQLGEELRQDWERQQREKLQTLQRLYQESLQLLGQGHRSAKENEPDLAAIAQREEENHAKAEERYREALKELKSQRLKDLEIQSRAINARKKALEAEKERSAKVASLPPPPPNPIQCIDYKKPHVVKKSDVSAFASTHYHMPETTVDREVDAQQPNACEGAELEVRRLQDLEKEEKRKREEQLEKARLRGKQALRREQLVQDRERLLVELEHMQQTDLLRRRQQVSQMPPQIFQPLYKRQETREDFQRDMEFAFEDMYTGERRVKGDLVVQLIPEPLPALSTDSQDQELDVTMDDITTPETENAQLDSEQEAGSSEQGSSAHVESSTLKPAPRRALKKLLDRIRSQRSQWTDHSSQVPAADSLTAITDQIPEHDTTIDTGSLTSEEKDKLAPHLQPPHSPPALKTTEEPATDVLLPDVLANRIQDFEEERKKKEEQLEREKQQQLILLQELEVQKAKLEQLLLEAQQEREHLKAAAAQELPVNQPEVPVHDQEVTSVPSGLSTVLVPPAGEDDHTRRIREYQQRLLEQNRLHQRSVDVARQRLEEYQRALRIRYMTSTSSLPAVTPLGITHQRLHSAQSVHQTVPLQLPTAPAHPVLEAAVSQTSLEVPTREFNMPASPLHFPGSCLSVGPTLLPDEVESKSNSSGDQRPDVTAWLTDNIMKRVTEHLPVRVRPSSSAEPMPCKLFTTHHSVNIPVQQPSGPVQANSTSITDSVPVVQGHADAKPQTLMHSSLQMGSLSSTEDDLERQRQELQEVQRRLLEQREAVTLQQRQQEEQRHRQEVQMEQMRRQKEVLQALIQTDAQVNEPVQEAAGQVLVSENIRKTRLKLLGSLLRAIEDSNGGTLSFLEEPQEKEDPPQQSQSNSGEKDPIAQSSVPAGPEQTSVLPSGFLPPHRAAKPPVTRVRLGIMEVMTEQHELSVIQEVETPMNNSLVTDSGGVWDLQEESELSGASDKALQPSSVSSTGQNYESPAGSVTSSSLIWRERLLTGAGTSPESSRSDSVQRIMSPLSSDSGRGADFSGPAVTSYRSHTESPHRPAESDGLSSTTISTGSYITTDPEQNTNEGQRDLGGRGFDRIIDKSSPVRRSEGHSRGADLLDVSSSSDQASCIKESSGTGRPGAAVHSLFNDSSIQRIIDRYTRELNISLSTAGRTTVHESSYLEEPGSSGSPHSLDQASETRTPREGGSSAGRQSPSDRAETQRSDLVSELQSIEYDGRVSPVLEHMSGEGPSLAEDPEQDSFRPLIGQLADESSCLIPDHRESAMVRLVGHPSAHSSMIGQLPCPASVSLDQGGWDSTLSRMIGRLSHQPSSHWLSGGQDFYAGEVMGRMALQHSSTWLDDGLGESPMRPLVGELDDQHSGSSGERTRVNLGVSTAASVSSTPPEPTSHSSSVPQADQQQLDQHPERTEVFPGSDSFHPLLAEVTHNDTADPSMTFHLPEHEVPNSPAEHPASGESAVSTPADEFESRTHRTADSELSPEHLRTQEQSSCPTALHESFSHLITSQCLPSESVLAVSPTMRTDVELTALSLTPLTMCDATPDLAFPLPEEWEADRSCTPDKQGNLVPCRDVHAEELTSEQGSNLRNPHVSDQILEVANEKGILEQSEITLVSLTDTTLQDQETTITEEEGIEHVKGAGEEAQRGQKTEGSESTLLPEETPDGINQSHPVKFLEFQWGPSRDLQEEVYQQKRTVLLQKLSHRMEEIKAKGALTKIQPKNHDSSAVREPSKPEGSQPLTCKTKTKSGPQLKTHKSKGRPSEQRRTTEKPGFIEQKKPQPLPPVSDSRLKNVAEVKLCTPEQRQRTVSEMHQRTQRLYERLEEVKHQKAIRSRQEDYAKNRLKAKEFHQKTLQKLRAKQTQK